MTHADDSSPKAVARRIRTQMQRHDLRFSELVRSLGMSMTVLEALASGRTAIASSMAAHMATALRCTTDYLLTGRVTK
jgi:transcriptional regulator with XRE-family HTH domain